MGSAGRRPRQVIERPGAWARESYRALVTLPQRIRDVELAVRAAQPRDPIDQFLYMSYATRRDGLFDGSYDLWRAKRMAKLLAIYGVDGFRDKTVLEVGAGHGDLGAMLASLGAQVTCAEGRSENLNFGRLKHRHVANLSFVEADLDEDFSHLGHFDLLVHFGLLYHIAGVEQHLARCFAIADDVVLETVVCDSLDPEVMIVVDERPSVNEEAISGRGSRPSPFYVERMATEHGFAVERHFSADLNSGWYVYDWEHRNDLGSSGAGDFNYRRFWRFTRQSDPASPT